MNPKFEPQIRALIRDLEHGHVTSVDVSQQRATREYRICITGLGLSNEAERVNRATADEPSTRKQKPKKKKTPKKAR
jgi:hypothetical protein